MSAKTKVKLMPVPLNGKPSRHPDLVSFAELHQQESKRRRDAKQMQVLDQPVAPAAPANEADAGSTIPGVDLSTAVQGFVSGLAVTGFATGLPEDKRVAVLNALSFCTLAANGDLSKNPATDYSSQWVSYLPTCAFVPSAMGRASYDSGDIDVALDQALLDCINQMSTDVSAINILKDVISALKTLPDNKGVLTLFSHNTVRNGKVSVMTTAITQPDDAPLQMQCTFYELEYSGTETRVLWITVNNSESKMTYTTVTADLRDDLYPTLEPLLTSRLTPHYKYNIATVVLVDAPLQPQEMRVQRGISDGGGPH
jgi:hypothetical protein